MGPLSRVRNRLSKWIAVLLGLQLGTVGFLWAVLSIFAAAPSVVILGLIGLVIALTWWISRIFPVSMEHVDEQITLDYVVGSRKILTRDVSGVSYKIEEGLFERGPPAKMGYNVEIHLKNRGMVRVVVDADFAAVLMHVFPKETSRILVMRGDRVVREVPVEDGRAKAYVPAQRRTDVREKGRD